MKQRAYNRLSGAFIAALTVIVLAAAPTQEQTAKAAAKAAAPAVVTPQVGDRILFTKRAACALPRLDISNIDAIIAQCRSIPRGSYGNIVKVGSSAGTYFVRADTAGTYFVKTDNDVAGWVDGDRFELIGQDKQDTPIPAK